MQIKSVYEEECVDIKYDNAFFKKLLEMDNSFINKNSDHIEFFGGTLTGVQVVRFTDNDRAVIFDNLLRIDEITLQEKLYALRTNTGESVIQQHRLVSSDVFNITCIYLLYCLENSRYLSRDHIEEAKIRVCSYLIYRFLTSRLFRHFTFPADKTIAEATYETLSLKYIIKQQGSWTNTIRYIANVVTNNSSIHHNTIKNFNDDNSILNMINDIQGRIRDMLKNIYNEHLKVKNSNLRMGKSNSLVEIDGQLVLKDKFKSLSNYTRYIKNIVSDKNSFIKPELIDVVSNVMHTMPEKLLITSLEWMSSNYIYIKDSLIEDAIDAIMHHAFDYLSEHRDLLNNRANLADICGKLRGTYMSSRANGEYINRARELTTKIVVNATKSKNESVIAATKTGLMIYIILRTFTMQHYAN